jgi:beta-phosphoglucomutase-like phosphatase (HAD superfamily)
MFEAVIFDCDGVLVDSEVLFHAVELEVLAEFGLIYESRAFKARFLGMSDAAYYAALEEEALAKLGRSILAELRPRMRARVLELFERKLCAVEGALDAVNMVRLPKAVASSSGIKALDHKLKRFGLWEPFAPHVYSSEHVAHAKPAPDLFLHAAAQLGVEPAACLVIEDSVNGVKAGLAAGMTVWGFSGGGHMDEMMRELLVEAGAHRQVADWAEAKKLFSAL